MALYPNGRAPDSALVSYRGHKASPDMARRVAWVEREYMKRNPGGYIRPSEIYRDYDTQVYWKQWWTDRGKPGNAAAPGYSNHGDWDVGAIDWDADNIALRTELAAQVGLIRTAMPEESWHYAVRGAPSVDLSGIASGNITSIEEDDMYNDNDRARDEATNKGVVDAVLRLYKLQQDMNTALTWINLNKWALTGNENPKAGLRSMVAEGFKKNAVVLADMDAEIDRIAASIKPAIKPNLAEISLPAPVEPAK